MAESYFDDFSDAQSPARLEIVQTALKCTAALVSVSLVLGLGVWSYRLMVRDVSGVPVLLALAGPARIAPEEPGGQQAAHQGLSVNRIAALGDVAPPPQRVVLAPRPIRLANDDRPMATNPAPRPIDTTPVVLAALRTTEPAPVPVLVPVTEAETLASDKAAQSRALAEEGGTAGAFGTALDAALAEALGVEGAIIRSPRPHSRPGAGALERITSLDVPIGNVESLSATPTEAAIDPDNLPVGTRLVQLGAFDDEALAKAEWDRLSTRFEAYLEGRRPLIQPAESNGREFVRLRAYGFSDEGDSRRFCAALLADGANCIPVLKR